MSDFADTLTADPVVIAPPEQDPAAPFGRFKNGKPKKGPAVKSVRAPKAAAGPAAPKPARRPTAAATSAKKAGPTDYRPSIVQSAGMFSLALVGMGRRNRAFLADAATVQLHAEPFAHALNEVAAINPAIARMLETTAPAAPYLLLGNALFAMGAQIAANHGKRIPAPPGAEIYDPEELATGMEQQMAQAVAQQAEQDRLDAEEAAEAAAYAAKQEAQVEAQFADQAAQNPYAEH